MAINTLYVDPNVIRSNMNWTPAQLPFLERLLTEPTDPPNTYYENIQTDIFNSSLTPKEQYALLGATAIGIYSSNYWLDAYNNVLNPWHGLVTTIPITLGDVFLDTMGWLVGLLFFLEIFPDMEAWKRGPILAFFAAVMSAANNF